MAIYKETCINTAVRIFDAADKYMDEKSALTVCEQAKCALSELKESITDFAAENASAIRKTYACVSSELGAKRNYRMQNTEFAMNSFKEYTDKIESILKAISEKNDMEYETIDAAFFNRDREFVVALFSLEENEAIPIPAEDAFAELSYMVTIGKYVDDTCRTLSQISNGICNPEKDQCMDGVSAKRCDAYDAATKLLATSFVRFTALLVRHVVNNTAFLFDHATDEKPRWEQDEIPSPSFGSPAEDNGNKEANRWAIFV